MHKSAITAMFLAGILLAGTFTIVSPFSLIDTEAVKDKEKKKYQENNYDQSIYKEYDQYGSDDYQYYEDFVYDDYYNNYNPNIDNIYETDGFNTEGQYKDPYSKDIKDKKNIYSDDKFDSKKKGKSSDNEYEKDYFSDMNKKFVNDKKSKENQKDYDKPYIEKKYKGDSFEFGAGDEYPDYQGKYQDYEKKSKYNKGNEYMKDDKGSYDKFGKKHNFGKHNLGLKDKDPINSCETCYLFYMDFLTRDELAVAYMELLNTLNQNGASLEQITNENDIPLFNSANIWEICEAISTLLSSGQDKSRILAGLLLEWANNIQLNIVSNEGIVRDVNGDNIGLVILAIIDCIAEQNHVKLEIQPSDITAHKQSIKSLQSNNTGKEQTSVNITETFEQNINQKQNEITTLSEDNKFQPQQGALMQNAQQQEVQNQQQENTKLEQADNPIIPEGQQKQTQGEQQQQVQNEQQGNTRMGLKSPDVSDITPSFPNIILTFN